MGSGVLIVDWLIETWLVVARLGGQRGRLAAIAWPVVGSGAVMGGWFKGGRLMGGGPVGGGC